MIAGIVILAVNPSRQLSSAQNAKRIAETNQLEKALNQFVIDNGKLPDNPKKYPATAADAVPICVLNPTNSNACVDLSELVKTYIAAIPKDPLEPCSSVTGYAAYADKFGPHVIQKRDTDSASCPVAIVAGKISNGQYTLTSDLDLQSGSLEITGNGSLNLNGHKVLNGTVTNNGTIVAQGNEQVTLGGANAGAWTIVGKSDGGTIDPSILNGKSITNLTIAPTVAGTVVKPTTALSVSGKLTVGDTAIFDTTGANSTFGGAISNNGAIILGDNAVHFNGGYDAQNGQTVFVGTTLPSTLTYHDLMINGNATVGADTTVNGALTVMTGKSLTISSGKTLTTKGDVSIQGKVTGAGALDLGNGGQNVTVGATGSLSGQDATNILTLRALQAWFLRYAGSSLALSNLNLTNANNGSTTGTVGCTSCGGSGNQGINSCDAGTIWNGSSCITGNCIGNVNCPYGYACVSHNCSTSCSDANQSTNCASNYVCNGGSCSLCGNGILDSGETCDDHTVAGGDGCSASCTIEAGWDCDTNQPSLCTFTNTYHWLGSRGTDWSLADNWREKVVPPMGANIDILDVPNQPVIAGSYSNNGAGRVELGTVTMEGNAILTNNAHIKYGIFNGPVISQGAALLEAGCTFNGTVTNMINSIIYGATFNGTVLNSYYIYSGLFNGPVMSTTGANNMIGGGRFNSTLTANHIATTYMSLLGTGQITATTIDIQSPNGLDLSSGLTINGTIYLKGGSVILPANKTVTGDVVLQSGALPSATYKGNLTLGTSVTLTGDVTVNGTLTLQSGTLNLAGHTITATSVSAQNGTAVVANGGSFRSLFHWMGATSTDWSIASNWQENLVPPRGADANIPLTINQPTIPSGYANDTSYMETLGTVTLSPSTVLTNYAYLQRITVNGNGSFVSKSPGILYTGDVFNVPVSTYGYIYGGKFNQDVSAASPWGVGGGIFNATFNGSVISAYYADVDGAGHVNADIQLPTGHSIHFERGLTINGLIRVEGGYFTPSGVTVPNLVWMISGNVPIATYTDLKIDPGADNTVSLQADTVVTGTLTLQSGTLNLAGHTLRYGNLLNAGGSSAGGSLVQL